jgi:hypothetical protein
MHHAVQREKNAAGPVNMGASRERLVDRIYMIAFVTMLIVMSVGYVCVGGLMLWAVFF